MFWRLLTKVNLCLLRNLSSWEGTWRTQRMQPCLHITLWSATLLYKSHNLRAKLASSMVLRSATILSLKSPFNSPSMDSSYIWLTLRALASLGESAWLASPLKVCICKWRPCSPKQDQICLSSSWRTAWDVSSSTLTWESTRIFLHD